MTASNKHRLYDLLEKRKVDEDAGLPEQVVLAEIESALAALAEFLVDPAACAVVKVVNAEEPNSVTYTDIGRLIVWADHIADSADRIASRAAMVNVAAREAYSMPEGYGGDGTPFTDHGTVKDRWRADQVARRFANVYVSTADVYEAVSDVNRGLFGSRA